MFDFYTLKMSGTGYSSLAHLFEFEEDQSQIGYKNALCKVLGKVRVRVGESYTHCLDKRVTASGFIPIDDFFKDDEVNLESCYDFISRLLKHYKVTDPSTYEIKFEKAVWSILVSNKKWYAMHNKYGSMDTGGIRIINMEISTVYHLFSLFNRFGTADAITVRMDKAYQAILLREFNIEPPKSKGLSLFCNFLQYVHSSNDAFVTVAIKKAYDKYVRDIVKEGRLNFQTKTISVKGGTLRAKVGKKLN